MSTHLKFPVERILAADGAKIAVRRRPRPGGTPVIFLHGLAANAYFWDLPAVRGKDFAFRSLADVLYESGHDVWLVNFRGHGAPDMYSEPAQGQDDWCVDHFAALDLAAVMDHVTAQGRRPFVISSSMGSMAIAAWLMGAHIQGSGNAARVELVDELVTRRHAQLAGAVLVEFPAALRWPVTAVDDDGKLNWSEMVRGLRRMDGSTNLPFELLARSVTLHNMIQRAGNINMGWLRLNLRGRMDGEQGPKTLAEGLAEFQRGAVQAGLDWIGKLTGHSHHKAEIVVRARRLAVDDMKAGVLAQMARSVRSGGFLSGLGEPGLPYSDHYSRIAAPFLLISGGRDRVANAEVCRDVFFCAAQSTDKTEFFLPDFGHGEYAATPAGCERVYPRILGWLAARDSLTRGA